MVVKLEVNQNLQSKALNKYFYGSQFEIAPVSTRVLRHIPTGLCYEITTMNIGMYKYREDGRFSLKSLEKNINLAIEELNNAVKLMGDE